MTEMVPLTSENLELCIELYMNVFNSEPWNERWTYETAKERLSDLLHTPKFLGFFFILITIQLVSLLEIVRYLIKV
ncbi:hypothetical protein P4646_17275 [Peribacillus simplex]|uniref:hypothetical protein n=1 Tax=Peribacillus simplex TaxID=1478 RepID=UPI002E1FA4D8|nr:hypothetical protein [Peribacillus simplex]MED4095039.1 hypothetical protein [Peribacillus simplex]